MAGPAGARKASCKTLRIELAVTGPLLKPLKSGTGDLCCSVPSKPPGRVTHLPTATPVVTWLTEQEKGEVHKAKASLPSAREPEPAMPPVGGRLL